MLFQKAQKKLNGNQNKIGRKNKERTRSLNRWYLSSPIGRILLTLSEKVSLCTSCAKIKKAGLSLDLADLKKAGRSAVMMAFVPASFEIVGYKSEAKRS